MPYVHRPVIGDNFEFGGTIDSVEVMTAIASDVSFGSITIPTITGTIKYIFIDVVLSRYQNTNALQNYLENNTNILVDNGTTAIAYTFPAGSFYGPAGSSAYFNGQRYYGSIDVKSKFTVGIPTNIYLHDAIAHHDTIDMRDLFAIARVVLN